MSSSEHEWDPQNVCFPNASRAVEEVVLRTVRAVKTQGVASDFDNTYNGDSENGSFDVGTLFQRLIASIKGGSIPRQAS
jgi:hypothetical protein